MKKRIKIIIPIIALVLILGVVLVGFYLNNSVKTRGNNETDNSAPAPSIDYSTLEVTVLNLFYKMNVTNTAGVSGQLNGYFAQVRVNKIINYTRYDPRNELKFNSLSKGDIINITLSGCSSSGYNYENISIGDKILFDIFSESNSGEPLYGGFNLWYEKCG